LGIHGHNIPEHRTNFLICSGNSSRLTHKGKLPYKPRITDLAATIAHFFLDEKDLQNEYFDGLPIGIKPPRKHFHFGLISTASEMKAEEDWKKMEEKTDSNCDLVIFHGNFHNQEEENTLKKLIVKCEEKGQKFSVIGKFSETSKFLFQKKFFISRGKTSFQQCEYIGPVQIFLLDSLEDNHSTIQWIEEYPPSGDTGFIFCDVEKRESLLKHEKFQQILKKNEWKLVDHLFPVITYTVSQ